MSRKRGKRLKERTRRTTSSARAAVGWVNVWVVFVVALLAGASALATQIGMRLLIDRFVSKLLTWLGHIANILRGGVRR
jgi:hypothetical protein